MPFISAFNGSFYIRLLEAVNSGSGSSQPITVNYSEFNSIIPGQPGVSSTFASSNQLRTNGTYTIVSDPNVSPNSNDPSTSPGGSAVRQAGWAWIVRNSDGAIMKSWNSILDGDAPDDASIVTETDTSTGISSKYICAMFGWSCAINDNYAFVSAVYRPVGGTVSNNNWVVGRGYVFAIDLTTFNVAFVFEVLNSGLQTVTSPGGSSSGGTAWAETEITATNSSLFIGASKALKTVNSIEYEAGAVTYYDISDPNPLNWPSAPSQTLISPVDFATEGGVWAAPDGVNYSNLMFGASLNVSGNKLFVTHTHWSHYYNYINGNWQLNHSKSQIQYPANGSYNSNVITDFGSTLVQTSMYSSTSGNFGPGKLNALSTASGAYSTLWQTTIASTNGYPGYNVLQMGEKYLFAGDGFHDGTITDEGIIFAYNVSDGSDYFTINNPDPSSIKKFGTWFDVKNNSLVTSVTDIATNQPGIMFVDLSNDFTLPSVSVSLVKEHSTGTDGTFLESGSQQFHIDTNITTLNHARLTVFRDYHISPDGDWSDITNTNRTDTPTAVDAYAMTFTDDGLTAFIGTQASPSGFWGIDKYTLTTPYRMNTSTKVQGIQISSPGNMSSISISSDGTKIVLAPQYYGSTVPFRVYTLSTPFDLTTATLQDQHLPETGTGQANENWVSSGCVFTHDGKYMITSRIDGSLSYSYFRKIVLSELTVPWDVSTEANRTVLYDFDSHGSSNNIHLSDDQTKLYLHIDTRIIELDVKGLEIPVDPVYEATMTTRAYINTTDIGENYTGFGANYRFVDNGNKILYVGAYQDGSSTWHRGARIASLTTPYDISTSTTATSEFDPATFANEPYIPRQYAPNDAWISDDGMTFYVMYGNWATSQTYWAREVYKFTLSSAWDLSTIADWTPTQTFSIASTSAGEQTAGMGASDHIPQSFWFNNDGTKIFFWTADGNAVSEDHLLEYPLSTAYDLTSGGTRIWHKFIDGSDPLNQLQSGDSFVPISIEFNDDGTKLFGTVSQSGYVRGITSWTLGTAWDISTLSKDSWEQDITDAYVDDNGDSVGTATRTVSPTAFGNGSLYIMDTYSPDTGNPIYQWDLSDVDFATGNRAFYSYSITNDTQSNSIDEGDTVVFTISAPDIPDDSIIYWEVDPYISTEIDDFDPATRSGTATFSNGTTTITVNIATDILDETNQNESFNLRLAKNESLYSEFSALVSSNIISIGEVPWISLDHTIQTPGLATTDRLGGNKASKGMNSTYTVVASYNKDDGANASSGEVYLYNTSTGALERTFTNPNAYNTTTNDFFGYSVGLSDSYLIVGAIFEDSAGGNSSGKAYVFNLSDGSLKYTLNNPNTYGTEESDHFGNSVAITDNYAIVGAYFEDSGTFGQETGAAYIFDMSDGSLAYTLTNPDSEPGTQDWFGFSVSINQHYAAVGAPLESYDISATNTGGKAYLYRLDTGALLHTVDNPGSNATYNANDQFGWDISLTNKHLIVGANQASTVDDSGTNTNAGKVDVFNLRDGTHLYTLENRPFGGINDYFGDTVDGSDNFLIAGTRDLDGTNNGGAYIYNINSGSYMTTLTNPNTYNGPDGDRFGSTVAILDDGTAAVGAWGEDTASTTDSGALYIYSSTYPVSTGAYTYKAIGDRGLIAGAINATYDYKIQYFDITTLGNAADFGTRYPGSGYSASLSNAIRGMWAGGTTATETGGGYNATYWVTISSLGNAYMWTTLLESTAYSAGVCDGDRGVIFGGPENFDDYSNIMQYISMSIASYQGYDFGNLTYAVSQTAGVGDNTYGIKAGGYYTTSYTRRIEMEKFTIQTTGGAAYLGDLTEARRKLTGTSNGTRGLFAGGENFGSVSTIDYITIATDTNATDFGDLSSALRGVSACSNETRAVFGGGYDGSSGSTALQYVSYDTPGTATSFGSLVAGTNNQGGSGLSGNAA